MMKNVLLSFSFANLSKSSEFLSVVFKRVLMERPRNIASLKMK